MVIATPDHWHALPAITACLAGKDVYCEKPLALTVSEGRLMVRAARKHNRVFQVGTQQRSLRPNEVACRLIREGEMGHVQRVVVANNWSPTDERLPGEDVPEGMDWDKWLGQARATSRSTGSTSFRKTSRGGQPTDSSAAARCAAGVLMATTSSSGRWGTTSPGQWVEAEGHEGNAKVRWWYDCGTVVETGDAPKPGGKFFCERGQLNIDRNHFNIMPGELKRELLRGVDVAESDEADHMRNFLDCVRSRKRPNADVEIGQRSVTVAHLANIARWVGGKLEWRSGGRKVHQQRPGERAAGRERREGYELPEV